MGYGNASRPPPKKPPKTGHRKVQKKPMSMTDRLKEHSSHHSKKHMAMMRKDIKAGMSFSAAHKKAQKSVGK